MNIRIPLLAGAFALASFSSASGALLIGFNSFDFGVDPQAGASGTNYQASGFTGFYNPTTGINKQPAGGSSDQTYGNSASEASTPGVNNGYVGIYDVWEPFLQLTNNSGATVVLDKLLFDAASSPAPTTITVAYRYGTSGVFTNLVTTAPLTSTFQSFSQSISSLQLTNGQTIQFRFKGDSGGQMDNFGVTGVVPEPSAALIAGGLLGVMALRRRRA